MTTTHERPASVRRGLGERRTMSAPPYTALAQPKGGGGDELMREARDAAADYLTVRASFIERRGSGNSANAYRAVALVRSSRSSPERQQDNFVEEK